MKHSFLKMMLAGVVLMACSAAFAQTGTVKVTLKNGTVLVGQVKAFDATKSITLVIGGMASEIPMSQVDRVEQVGAATLAPSASAQPSYPDSFTVKVGNKTLTMLLIKGGEFMMGYDGRYSLSMGSEPVHKVRLSPFYVSRPIDYSTYMELTNEVLLVQKKSDDHTFTWLQADKFCAALSKLTGKTFHICTEAQWEYLAFGSQNTFREGYVYWCNDFYAPFSKDTEVQTDPQGPGTGIGHARRYYNPGDHERWRGQHDRLFYVPQKAADQNSYRGYFVITMNAAEVL